MIWAICWWHIQFISPLITELTGRIYTWNSDETPKSWMIFSHGFRCSQPIHRFDTRGLEGPCPGDGSHQAELFKGEQQGSHGSHAMADGNFSTEFKHDEHLDFCPEKWFQVGCEDHQQRSKHVIFTGFKPPKGDLSNEGQWTMTQYERCVLGISPPSYGHLRWLQPLRMAYEEVCYGKTP